MKQISRHVSLMILAISLLSISSLLYPSSAVTAQSVSTITRYTQITRILSGTTTSYVEGLTQGGFTFNTLNNLMIVIGGVGQSSEVPCDQNFCIYNCYYESIVFSANATQNISGHFSSIETFPALGLPAAPIDFYIMDLSQITSLDLCKSDYAADLTALDKLSYSFTWTPPNASTQSYFFVFLNLGSFQVTIDFTATVQAPYAYTEILTSSSTMLTTAQPQQFNFAMSLEQEYGIAAAFTLLVVLTLALFVKQRRRMRK